MFPKYPVKILLIEVDTEESFRNSLEKRGHRVHVAHTWQRALDLLAVAPPDVIVVDGISSPEEGKRICSKLRECGVTTPIIALRDYEAEDEDENGEANGVSSDDRTWGADECLVMPFTYRKLLSRIARLVPARDGEILRAGDLTLNVAHRRLFCNGRRVHLTKKLARLLEIFMRHPGEILSRSHLMREVWQTEYVLDTRTLDTHVSWLRQAIEEDPRCPRRLLTVHGVGYMLVKEAKNNEREH